MKRAVLCCFVLVVVNLQQGAQQKQRVDLAAGGSCLSGG